MTSSAILVLQKNTAVFCSKLWASMSRGTELDYYEYRESKESERERCSLHEEKHVEASPVGSIMRNLTTVQPTALRAAGMIVFHILENIQRPPKVSSQPKTQSINKLFLCIILISSW